MAWFLFGVLWEPNAHGNAKINVMHADARTAYERKKVSNEHERR
jgi:hypothetical protein